MFILTVVFKKYFKKYDVKLLFLQKDITFNFLAG